MDTSLAGVPGDSSDKNGLGIGDFFIILLNGVFFNQDSESTEVGLSLLGVLKRSVETMLCSPFSDSLDEGGFFGVFTGVLKGSKISLSLDLSFDGVSGDSCSKKGLGNGDFLLILLKGVFFNQDSDSA